MLIAITGELGSSLMKNGIRSALSLETVEGVTLAKEIIDALTNSSVDPDTQLLRFKLLVAILDRDQGKAIETWPQLRNTQFRSPSKEENLKHFLSYAEAKYAKDSHPDSGDWDEGLQTLEQSILVALNEQMNDEVVIHCLSALGQELNQHLTQTAALVRITRYVPILRSHN